MYLVIFCLLFSFADYIPVKGEIIWYLSLTARFISLSIMLSSYIHAVAKGISSFFLSAVKNSIVYLYHRFWIHSFADGHLGGFQYMAIVYCAAMNIWSAQVLLDWCFRVLRV